MGLITAGLAALAGAYAAKKVGQAVSAVGQGVRDAAVGAQEVVKTFMPSTYDSGSSNSTQPVTVTGNMRRGANVASMISTYIKRRENNK